MEKFCWKLLFWQIFLKNFVCVFSRSNTILAISQEWLVRLMWNEKEVHGWILGTIYDLDLWLHSWPWPWMVKFRNSSISGIVGLIDVKWKGSELIWYWADCMTLALWPHLWPWPWSFKVRVWNSFISGMGWPIDNEWKGCESSIHDHDIDLCDHG